MKRACLTRLSTWFLLATCASALAQLGRPPGRSMISAVSAAVQVMTSDVVAVGKIEDSGTIEELDVVMPLDDKPTRQRLQRFRLHTRKILRDTAGGPSVFSNTVIDVLATLPGAITNAAASDYRKDVQGVFLMKRLAGRNELLLPRHIASLVEETRLSGMAAGIDGLGWGGVTNGLQMAVLQIWPAMAATNDPTVRIGVAVRNVSGRPIAFNRAQAGKRLVVEVDGSPAAVVDEPPPIAAATNAPAPRAVVTVLPNQIVMLAPKGNADSGFPVSLSAGETWLVKAAYEPVKEKDDDPPFWKGRLESGTLTVKAFKPPVRAPRKEVSGPGSTPWAPKSGTFRKVPPSVPPPVPPSEPPPTPGLLSPVQK